MGVSEANDASRHVLVTVPRSARIVFVPLVNMQKDYISLLHCIKRMVCNVSTLLQTSQAAVGEMLQPAVFSLL